MYADPTSSIYTAGRNMLSSQAQNNAVLQNMMNLRKFNASGMGGQGFSGVQQQNQNEIFGQNFQQAMGQMGGMYMQGQGTADSIYSNVASGSAQLGNAMAGLHFDVDNATYQADMDFLTGALDMFNFTIPIPVSDIALKENIELVGKSESGINIYEFDYKDKLHGEGRYRGVMAQEVPDASIRHEEGYLTVDYSKVDVNFERIDTFNI